MESDCGVTLDRVVRDGLFKKVSSTELKPKRGEQDRESSKLAGFASAKALR